MNNNRLETIVLERSDLNSEIRRLEAKLMSSKYELTKLRREEQFIESQVLMRTPIHQPIQVHKHVAVTAPPNNTNVSFEEYTVGTYDTQGRYDFVLQDVDIVARTIPRTEKHMEELKKRREAMGGSPFGSRSHVNRQLDMAA